MPVYRWLNGVTRQSEKLAFSLSADDKSSAMEGKSRESSQVALLIPQFHHPHRPLNSGLEAKILIIQTGLITQQLTPSKSLSYSDWFNLGNIISKSSCPIIPDVDENGNAFVDLQRLMAGTSDICLTRIEKQELADVNYYKRTKKWVSTAFIEDLNTANP